MERESNPMQALCRSGCGFYGSPATDGLCSLCYKEALKKKQQPPVSAPSPASSVNTAQSLTSLMETATAQPTVPCLPTATTPASTESNIESMSQSHIPIDKICENQENNGSENASNSGGPDVSIAQNEATDESHLKGETKDCFDNSENAIEEGASANAAADTSATDADNTDKDGDKDAKKKKNRCATCRKKVGLTGFECRCGGLFCAVHRYSDKHDCSFNYREMGAQEIRRNNPVVVGEKIQKI
ncbi:hypothetical protein Trydic_g6924 [Trypoxylus dichotomus]